MNQTKTGFKPIFALIGFFMCVFFFSCQKDFSGSNGTGSETADFTSKVTASLVSGFVTNDNNNAVMGATVRLGTNTVTTDKYGYFEFRNTEVIKTAALVTVTHSGYFNGIKTFIGANNKGAFFRVKLIPKTTAGSFNAATGGSVQLTNGLRITLPASGVMNANTLAYYTGNVSVSASWLDPSSLDLPLTMPGDLRGISTDGALKALTTYGMIAVELRGSAGELLQVATGSKAGIEMPIPPTHIATAPATIPLWYFDEAKGLWKEEGQATKTGSSYIGDVSHFSFWNCDVPNNYVQLTCTIQDNNGNPVAHAYVRLSETGNPNNAAGGFTDSAGYVGGAVPPNKTLVMNVYASYSCFTPAYTQSVTTTNQNIALGVINIPAGTLASVSGNLTTCNNTPVTDGYIMMLYNNQYFRKTVTAAGAFNFTTALCGASQPVSFVAVDNAAQQQGSLVNYTLVTGNNPVGTLQACGTAIPEFLNYSINGGATVNFTPPGDSLAYYPNATSAFSIYANRAGTTSFATLQATLNGIAPGSSQTLISFRALQLPQQPTIPNPITVNITEFGNVGQFISGNFSGTLADPSPPNTTYTVTCSFRVRRTQ